MSEAREECYKCLNNQRCISGADYGSIYCSLNRKYKMQGREDDNVLATMQKQIEEKDKRIAELEEENMQKGLEIIGAKEYTEDNMRQIIEKYYTANEDCIPKQKIKNKIEEFENMLNETFEGNIQKHTPGEIVLIINALNELLEKN